MKTKNKGLAAVPMAALPIAVVFMMVFTFAGCDNGGGRGGEVVPLDVFPIGFKFVTQGRIGWPSGSSLNELNNYLVDDDGLLALGLESDGEYSTWELYAEVPNLQFTPGAKQKLAIRNITTGNFINRKGVTRTPRETNGVQLKVSPYEPIDEFFWHITTPQTGAEGFNFANYNFTPGTGGIWSFAGTGNVPMASGKNSTYKAVLWVHADHVQVNDPVNESDWDTWDASTFFKGVIEGRGFNFFPK
ncbi:MAG: hypothetical protein LBB72_03335 [Spirochaetaceae bacterium]|nr:hypothetical protein [Spirochaetaceae bacterium]